MGYTELYWVLQQYFFVICFCRFDNEMSLYASRSLAAPSSIVEHLKMWKGGITSWCRSRERLLFALKAGSCSGSPSNAKILGLKFYSVNFFCYRGENLWRWKLLDAFDTSVITHMVIMLVSALSWDTLLTVCQRGLSEYLSVCGAVLILIQFLLTLGLVTFDSFRFSLNHEFLISWEFWGPRSSFIRTVTIATSVVHVYHRKSVSKTCLNLFGPVLQWYFRLVLS